MVYPTQPRMLRPDHPFPDPFLDYASTAMPTDIHDALSWSEFIVMSNPIYRSVLERLVSYFITEVEILDTDDKMQQQLYLDYLYDELKIVQGLRIAALNFLTYGNSFISTIGEISRHLICPGCGLDLPLKVVNKNKQAWGFRWNRGRFSLVCPRCKKHGEWNRVDRQLGSEGHTELKHWNPKEIMLQYDMMSGSTKYFWNIPESYRLNIERGLDVVIENCPFEVIEAALNKQSFEIENRSLFHAKEQALAGINTAWGISRVFTNFRQAWYVQILHRTNEAIGLDHIIPLRLLSPAPRSGQDNDPIFTLDIGGSMGAINSLIAKHRMDPLAWHAAPFPIQVQSIGAETDKMVPAQLMEQGTITLVEAIGAPIEFYKMNMSWQTQGAALRLMESLWSPLRNMLNGTLQWIGKRLADRFNWNEVRLRLQKPTVSDDLNRQLTKIQMAMQGMASRTSGLAAVGLDFETEMKRTLEEEKFLAEATKKKQEEIDALGLSDMMLQGQVGDPMAGATPAGMPAGAPAGPAPTGAPMPAAGSTTPGQPSQLMPVGPVEQILAMVPPDGANILLTDIEPVSNSIASKLLTLPDSMRHSALLRLRQRNETVHALVKARLEQERNRLRQEGMQFMLAAGGGQPPM